MVKLKNLGNNDLSTQNLTLAGFIFDEIFMYYEPGMENHSRQSTYIEMATYMNIEELRQLKNRSVAQQNQLMYLEMKICAQNASSQPWLREALSRHGCDFDAGVLILLSSIPDQAGTLWYGTWLTQNHHFYEFVVATSRDGNEILEVESWAKATPEVAQNVKGIGKTPAFIAIEVLSEFNR